MKMMHATRSAGAALLLVCGVARGDLIIDVNGTQVGDDPGNTFLPVSGSIDGLNYDLNLSGVIQHNGGPQNILSFNSGFTSDGTAPAPVTFTITETNLSAIPGYNGRGFVGGNSVGCMLPDFQFCQLPAPGLTAAAWFDPTNSGSRVTVISQGGTVPPFASQYFNSGPLALSAPFSLTDEFTVDPVLFSLAPNGIVGIAGTVDYVPEPGIWSLLALGLAGLGFTARRRTNRLAPCRQAENFFSA